MRSKYIYWLVLSVCLVRLDGGKILVAVTPGCEFLFSLLCKSYWSFCISVLILRIASNQASYENPSLHST